MPATQFLLLGLPSLALLVLLLWHRYRLQGGRVVAVFFLGVALYALLRAEAIGAVMAEIGGDRPYLMRHALLSLGASSPQEIVGWGVAVGLAWALAERMTSRFGWRAGPARVSLLAMAAMMAICAAVEGAAIAAGWWRWTLPAGAQGALWNVPSVALLDWGFVALDFLLPVLVWQAYGLRWPLLLALGVFPAHFLIHSWIAPALVAVPLTGYALGHIFLVAAVATAAYGERGQTRDLVGRETWWWMPPTAALGLAVWTAISAVWSGVAWPITSLPLMLIGVTLFTVEGRAVAATATGVTVTTKRRTLAWHRLLLFALVSAAGIAILWPGAARDRALQSEVEIAVAAVARGDLARAEQALREAQDIVPEHPAVATLRGLVALREARYADATAHLEQALHVQPNSRSALQLASVAGLRQQQTEGAYGLASRGRSLFPRDLGFRYLEAASSSPSSASAVIVLAKADPKALSELAMLAELAGDRAMLMACQEALRAATPASAHPESDDF